MQINEIFVKRNHKFLTLVHFRKDKLQIRLNLARSLCIVVQAFLFAF